MIDDAELARAARDMTDAIEGGGDPRSVFLALTALLAAAARVEGAPPRRPPPAVPPVSWSAVSRDALRRTADEVFRDEAPAVDRRVRELHALVAPWVEAGDMRALAWSLGHAWGDVATSLVRPLWELAYG